MRYDEVEFEEEDGVDSIVIREGEAPDGKGYRGLRVYRLAHELGVASPRLSLTLPKYELYETGSQLRRAAKSVSANLVEGYGRRRHKAEHRRFLTYAKASLDETEGHLLYVQDCHPGHHQAADALLQAADVLGRKLSRFFSLVEAKRPSQPATRLPCPAFRSRTPSSSSSPPRCSPPG